MTPEEWQVVKRVFNDAEERAPAERAAFIAEACAGDPRLRAEVEELLACGESASVFFDDSAFEAVRRLDEESEATGAIVDRYRLLREVGRGGMGAVYLAERVDAQFEQRVALKVIKRGMDTEAILRRFVMERQILASLDHPNVARLLDGGTTPDGLPYFVMEYVEGEPIDNYCETRGLTTAARLALFRKVCDAVTYAHRNLVVHRDLKPSNILVTDEGTPKLLDFGIAKLLQPGEDGAPTVEPTATNLRALTPEYASPEQVRGLPVTTSSDVYSLGVLLYELLTGRRPYRFKSRALHEIAAAITTEEPERPSAAVSRAEADGSTEGGANRGASATTSGGTRGAKTARLSRRLRGDLDTIVMTALRKEPERRYGSVEQLSEDIRRHLEGLPVAARGDTFGYRAAKFFRRHSRETAAAALVLLALVAGLAAATWQARVARRERALAESRFNDVRELANAFVFKYHDAIRSLPRSTPVREMLVRDALQYLDRLARQGGDHELRRELAAAYVRVGLAQGDPWRMSLGDTAGALGSQRQALGIREALAAAAPADPRAALELAESYERVAELVWLAEGELKQAQELFKKALGLVEPLAESGDAGARRRLAVSLYKYGSLHGSDGRPNLGDTRGGMEHLRRSASMLEELLRADPSDRVLRAELATSYLETSWVLFETDEAAALDLTRRALEIQERLVAEDPFDPVARFYLAFAHHSLSVRLSRQGDIPGAVAEIRTAVTLGEDVVAADPTDVVMQRELSAYYLWLGSMLQQAGQPAGAMESYSKGVAIKESLVAGPKGNHYDRTTLGLLYQNIGKLQAQEGEYAEAIRNLGRALDYQTEILARQPANFHAAINLAGSHAGMRDALLGARDYAAAIESGRRALQAFEKLLADNPSSLPMRAIVARAHRRLADAHAAHAAAPRTPAAERRGHWQEAKTLYDRSLGIYLELQIRNAVPPAQSNAINELKTEIARCDAAL